MPKIVDHGARRDLIARAFAAHVAELGFSATTYARTAAATGYSVGTIQHYFGSRDELAQAAFDRLLADRDARISDVVAAGEAEEQPIRAILRRAVTELLPMDEARRREHRVTLWLRVEGQHDPTLARIASGSDADLHRRVAQAVVNGTRCGEVEPRVDPAVAASMVLATVHGLALELASGGGPAAEEVLDPVLATVFTGRCRHHDV